MSWLFSALAVIFVAVPAGADDFDSVAFDLISKWEGKENHAYFDRIASPPLWTICYGHTKTAQEGQHKTDAECRDLLIEEIAIYRAGLHKHFTADTKAKRLPTTRDAAYTSLAYNVGVRGAGRSTATRRLNAGDIAGGCKALTWWNRAGGRVVRGLVRRRSDEYEFCVEGL
ncbi:MAG: lysozyme [Pseudoruegeria sp.]